MLVFAVSQLDCALIPCCDSSDDDDDEKMTGTFSSVVARIARSIVTDAGLTLCGITGVSSTALGVVCTDVPLVTGRSLAGAAAR